MPTSSEKATEKVERSVTTGEMPDIDSGYERDRIVRGLRDYANHSNSSDLVVERAENAIEDLAGD